MERMKGTASFRNPGKQHFLPPKSPFPSISAPAYGEYGTSGSKEAPWLREGQRQHQPRSPESIAMEEQFTWLDELLDEPEIPVKRGAHRRCSSDSRIYSNLDNFEQKEWGQRAIMPTPLWGLDDLHYFADQNSSGRLSDTVWVSGLNMGSYSNNLHDAKGKGIHASSSGVKSKVGEKLEQEMSPEDLKSGYGKKNVSQATHTQLETDSKRVQQQFTHRSRARKIQYITELESCVEALQAQGLEVSAQLKFVDKQNFILSLENKVLKQRLDGLLHEQLIKCLQQEMLEQEIARLQLLFKQQQPQQPSSSRGNNNSVRELNSQFANIYLKHRDGLW